MKKINLFILCYIFLIYALGPDVFAQGKEWQRIRTDASSKEWQRIRQGNIVNTTTRITGSEILVPEYYIAQGDTMAISIWQVPDIRQKGSSDKSEYFITIGDTITISVWRDDSSSQDKGAIGSESESEYFISRGDVIRVFVWQNPDLSQDVTVGPDGNISYPLVGRFKAAGMTIKQIEDKLISELTKYVKYPEVSAGIVKYTQEEKSITEKNLTVGPDGTISYPLVGRIQASGLSISQLEEEIKLKLPKHMKGSQVFVTVNEFKGEKGAVIEEEVVVAPDGTISCPIIGRLDAAGLSLGELEEELVKKVPPHIKNAKALVTMKEFSGSKIIVFGEVNYPGIYTYTGSINLIELVGMAGDFTKDARSDSVMIVRGNLTDEPEIIRIDMLSAIREGTSNTDIILEPNDVIYVPETFISNFNKFFDLIMPVMERTSDILGFRKEIRTLQGYSR